MKFGIIKERKNPPDKRAVLSPLACKRLKETYPQAIIQVESCNYRAFTDDEYRAAGVEVVNDVSGCDVLLGVKEVPVEALIPNKKYFFFSHTIKQQPHNRKLLRAILDKNIQLFDHEVITNNKGARLVAFGRYAGIVGAYNGFRAFGLKSGLFQLPKAETLQNQQQLIEQLKHIKSQLPPIKVLLTGKGRVGSGAKEMLEGMGLKKVGVKEYLTKTFYEPVYCQIDVLDYNKRKDGHRMGKDDFYKNPQEYESDFLRFAQVTHLYIAGHYYGSGAPVFFTAEDVKRENFQIKVIADISCDIGGPIPTTLRASTIAEPLYGYHRQTGEETHYQHEEAIAVMAVDNLPCELPRDASEGFGESFLKYVIPAFFNGDAEGILLRAKMTENGKLTERFKYLEDYVEEREAV